MKNRLKEIRKTLGLSGEKLAEMAGTTKTQISRLEAGERRLSDHWIQRIVEGLHKAGFKDIQPYYFFTDPGAVVGEKDRELIARFNALPEQGRVNIWASIELEEFKAAKE